MVPHLVGLRNHLDNAGMIFVTIFANSVSQGLNFLLDATMSLINFSN